MGFGWFKKKKEAKVEAIETPVVKDVKIPYEMGGDWTDEQLELFHQEKFAQIEQVLGYTYKYLRFAPTPFDAGGPVNVSRFLEGIM